MEPKPKRLSLFNENLHTESKDLKFKYLTLMRNSDQLFKYFEPGPLVSRTLNTDYIRKI